MAKTASQIVAERKEVSDYRNAVHEKQMAEVGAKAAARTAAVLNAAGHQTTINPQTYEVSIVGTTTPKTTEQKKLDLQHKKETQAEAKTKNDAISNKYHTAKKQYEDYLKSDEHRQRLEEADRKQRERKTVNLFLPNADMQAPEIIQDEKEISLRAAMNAAEAEVNAEADRKVVESDLEAITGLSNEERKELEQYSVNQIRDQNLPVEFQNNPFMKTAEQEASGLIGKIGKQRADELAETYMRQQNAALARQAAASGAKAAGTGFWSGLGASVGTVPINVAAGLVGSVGQLQGAARNTGRYQTLDPNATGTALQTYTGAVRGQVQQNIEGEDPNFWRKAASIGYQGLMSAADSLAQAYLGGAVGGAALAATNSFSQTMAEASANGATPGEAALLATATAGIEALSEKIPLDNLLDTAKGGKQTLMQAIGNALKQAGIEATTEEISLLGTVLAEAAILKENSSYQRSITAKILSGIAPEQAKMEALREILEEAKNTALVSMVSGGASSLSSSAAANVMANERDTTPNAGTPEEIKQQALEQVRNTEAQKAAPAQQAADVAENATSDKMEAVADKISPAEVQTAATEARPEQKPAAVSDIVTDMARENTTKQQAQEEAQRPKQNEVAPQTDTRTDVQQRATERVTKPAEAEQAGANERIAPQQAQLLNIYTSNIIKKAEQNGVPSEILRQMYDTTRGINAFQPTKADVQTIIAAMEPIADRLNDSNIYGYMDAMREMANTEPGIKGTGAAEQNFSGKAEYQNLLSDDNVQRDREGDVRPMEVPKTDSFGKRVSELVGNAYGAEVTTDKMANAIEELVQDGALGFDTRTNQESLNNAAAEIEKRGIAATRKQITNAVSKGKIRDGDIEQAILLYTMYNSKDTESAIDNASEILVDLATMANITGRNLQMFRMLRQLTPEGQTMSIKKQVEKNIESMIRSGTVKKGYTTEIDPELLNEYRKAAQENMRAVSEQQKKTSAEKMKTIMDAIYAMEAAKMPTTFKAKWDAWRYMAMLGNAKTQVRNIVGNTLFVPYKQVKDRTAALAEKLFVKKENRTKSVFTDLELLEWARQDRNMEDVKNALRYSGKIGDDITDQKIRDGMQVFKNKGLDNVRKFIENVPAAGDMLFKNGYYARSLADFMKARGYRAADIQNGKVSAEVLNEARSYAVQEAMKATFNDANVLSDFFATGIHYKGDNPVGKVWNMAMEGVLPFRRTPANIAARFEEYSPLGIVNTIWKAVDPMKTGKYTAADVVDSLASSLTGSAAMALGFVLAKGLAGVKLTGSDLSEDEERQGHQEYALEYADKEGNEYSYKIDWAAPANLPLFVGANIYDAFERSGEDTDVSKFTSFLRGIGNAFEPMLALSCLSGINDLFESARYANEDEALYTVAANIATGYFTQGIPALLRQASQASQEVKRTTFSESNDPTIRDIESTLSGIPFYGEKFKTDKVTAWGEKESTGTARERIVNAFINPGTRKKIDNGALEKEISRLNKAQTDTNVSPSYIPKVISYTDKEGTVHKNHRLTEEQYQSIAQTQGQTERKILDKMINSKNYAAMTDEQKAKAFDQVYSYAREKAIVETLGTAYGESWMMKLRDGAEAEQILLRTTDNAISNALAKLDTAWDNGYSAENTASYSRELEEEYNSYSKMTDAQKKEVRSTATGSAAKYIEAREKGISHADFITTARNVNNVKGTGKNGTVRDIDRRQAIAKTTGLTPAEVDKMMKVYMPDYDKTDDSPETTEFKYQYIREELDLSPAEYASTYKAYLDGEKKAGKIADIMKLGYDYKTASAIYKVHSGSMKQKLIAMYG